MKWLSMAAAAVLMTLAGGFAPAPASANTEIVTLAGAGPQGRWFKEASIVAKLMNEKFPQEGVQFNGVTGKGVSIGNIKRLAADRIQGGRGFLADLVTAYDNEGAFKGDVNYEGVVAWTTLNPLIFRLIADNSIKSYADLKGKTVAVGAKNSGDDARAVAILNSYGVTEENTTFRYIGRSDAQNALTNHQIDALLISYSRNNRGHLAPVFAARPINEDVVFVDPDPEVTKKFLESHPALYLDTLGEPVFGRPDLKGVAVRTGFMIRKDLPEQLVYDMTKTLYENWDTVLASAPWWGEKGAAGPDVATSFQATPYHPGAIRYYKEAGMWSE